MRNHIPTWTGRKSEISRNRYTELKSFCLQYPERVKNAASFVGPRACGFAKYQKNGIVSDPTYSAVEKREKLLKENELIDKCLNAGGEWARALKLNVCQGVALHHIEPQYMPTSNRNAFFDARKAFFLMLNDLR